MAVTWGDCPRLCCSVIIPVSLLYFEIIVHKYLIKVLGIIRFHDIIRVLKRYYYETIIYMNHFQPVGVFFQTGCDYHLAICILLTLLGYIPG